ncbi:MAG: hypothetical protein HFG27_04420 [Provencibacterium sp.]|jgi:uncharacterized protein YukE|nr:hypothetical protein [Provencibacterium sp.]
MTRITADPALIDEAANQLEQASSILDAQAVALAGIREETTNAWICRYTDLYLQKIDRLRSEVRGSSDHLSSLASTLHSIASKIRRLEKELSEKMKAR